MSKICKSCGALNSDRANTCMRCGKSISYGGTGGEKNKVKPEQTHFGSKYIIIVGVVLLLAIVLLYKFAGNNKGVPQLTEAECEQLFSDTICEQEEYLRGIFQEERREEPIACSIADIEQDDKSAVVTYNLSAKYNYADCDLTCHCNAIYIDTTETWKQTNSEVECKWNYHDLGGVWQQEESFYSEPKIIYVETRQGGYAFTATANWNSDEQGTKVEIMMDDLEPDSEDGEKSIFNFPHVTREPFRLSPEEGITEMEKIQDEWAADFEDSSSENP